MEISFLDVNDVEDSKLFAAVIIARHKNKWILCKHKERDTWEFPGGHREEHESILETAKRELFEETGAIEFEIRPVCAYSLRRYAMLFYAEVKEIGALPNLEMEKIGLFDEIPKNLTYAYLHGELIKKLLTTRDIIDI